MLIIFSWSCFITVPYKTKLGKNIYHTQLTKLEINGSENGLISVKIRVF
jgi:hypothetical protein